MDGGLGLLAMYAFMIVAAIVFFLISTAIFIVVFRRKLKMEWGKALAISVGLGVLAGPLHTNLFLQLFVLLLSLGE